eukprot:IDg21115t1
MFELFRPRDFLSEIIFLAAALKKLQHQAD